MKKKRYSEAEIVAILQEAEAASTKAEVWRKHGVLFYVIITPRCVPSS